MMNNRRGAFYTQPLQAEDYINQQGQDASQHTSGKLGGLVKTAAAAYLGGVGGLAAGGGALGGAVQGLATGGGAGALAAAAGGGGAAAGAAATASPFSWTGLGNAVVNGVTQGVTDNYFTPMSNIAKGVMGGGQQQEQPQQGLLGPPNPAAVQSNSGVKPLQWQPDAYKNYWER